MMVAEDEVESEKTMVIYRFEDEKTTARDGVEHDKFSSTMTKQWNSTMTNEWQADEKLCSMMTEQWKSTGKLASTMTKQWSSRMTRPVGVEAGYVANS